MSRIAAGNIEQEVKLTASVPFKSATHLTRLTRSKALSPVELMEETLKRIDRVNQNLNAFVTLRADEALEEENRASRS